MRGLTRWLVHRHTDMPGVEDYFDGYAVAGGRLAGLQVPVDVLAAADDPIIPVDTLHTLQLPAHSTLEIVEHGGHCGFIEGASLRGFARTWVAARLIAALEPQVPEGTTAAARRRPRCGERERREAMGLDVVEQPLDRDERGHRRRHERDGERIQSPTRRRPRRAQQS
jgi:hypothetical protein